MKKIIATIIAVAMLVTTNTAFAISKEDISSKGVYDYTTMQVLDVESYNIWL